MRSATAEEQAPEANQLKVRENGPYALHAATVVDDGFRATLRQCGMSKRKPWCEGSHVARVTQTALCRCGHSGPKPFCDGSHRAAGFVAAGR